MMPNAYVAELRLSSELITAEYERYHCRQEELLWPLRERVTNMK